ncbi:protein LTO1 homolog [Asterias amurensis]|uniref:protein LTO1 homolog n=1 Tax=Asterias amurensis TaxID=7602 RepID=UPI003AB5A329
MAENPRFPSRGVGAPDEDPFDSLVMAEERFNEMGFEEGFQAGKVTGKQDGFKLGQDKGRQIGSEYGFYLGFISTWRQLLQKDSELAKPKAVKALGILHSLLVSFRLEDVTQENYWEDFKKIRDKFKQVASLLNVSLDFSDKDTQKPPLSF